MQGQCQMKFGRMDNLPGVAFRPFMGNEDFDRMVAVVKACRPVDHFDYVRTAEGYRNMFENSLHFNPQSDLVLVEVEGQVIGFGYARWWQEDASNQRVYRSYGYVHPRWRKQGIGRELLAWTESRLREIAAQQPHNDSQEFRLSCSDLALDSVRLYLRTGYRPLRYFYEMVRPNFENIPEAPLPAGIEVRPVLPEHYRKIWEADQEAFQDHWGNIPPTEAMYQEWLGSNAFQPQLWKVAWDGDQIAGQVLNFIDHKENEDLGRLRGYTEDISVRLPWRRRGLASALIALSLHMHREMHMQEAALGVDTENSNGALNLYTRMGFQVEKRLTVYHKPLE